MLKTLLCTAAVAVFLFLGSTQLSAQTFAVSNWTFCDVDATISYGEIPNCGVVSTSSHTVLSGSCPQFVPPSGWYILAVRFTDPTNSSNTSEVGATCGYIQTGSMVNGTCGLAQTAFLTATNEAYIQN